MIAAVGSARQFPQAGGTVAIGQPETLPTVAGPRVSVVLQIWGRGFQIADEL